MSAEPVATGTLAKTPLPHLLIYLDQRQLSGTLAIWPETGLTEGARQDRILFLKGRPIAGRMIDPAKTLREGLLQLFVRIEAPYAFYEGNLLGGTDERLNGRVDPLSLITESLRTMARADIVDNVLAHVGAARLRLQPKVDLSRFEFAPEERALLDLIMAEPADIESLVAGSGLPRTRARRLLYLLLISKSVAPYAEAKAPAAPASTPQAAPVSTPQAPLPSVVSGTSDESQPMASVAATDDSPSIPPLDGIEQPQVGRLDRLAEMPSPPDHLSPELAERWQRITSRGRLVENQTFFEMLGLDKKVQASEVKAEFFKLAKEWHPDRLPPELQPLRPFVEIIFAYMNEAYKTLSDEGQRLQYVRTVREGGGTPAAERLMQAILDSAIAYERVQVFVRKHQYEEALELLNKILLINKDEPDYHAMNGFLLMQKHPGDTASGAILAALDRAIELHEDHEKAHLYKAQMLKRLGREKDALKEFRKVVSINANNLEASREVRVAQMRTEKQQPTATKAAAGLLGKLLGGGDKGGKKK
jgi:curved DNA-binding protein CbpA